jgi:hypothetical protein
MFNALNHTNFTGISTSINAANFGRFTSLPLCHVGFGMALRAVIRPSTL